MVEPIFLRVGEGTVVELPELVGAMNDFLGLLREFDSTVAQRRAGNLIWRVTTLEKAPAPIVGVTPFTKGALNDTSERVERELISNVSALTKRGDREKLLSDAALNRVERIAKMSPRIGPSLIYTSVKNVPLVTIVNVETLKHVKELTAVQFTSYGTIVGCLGSISVHKGHELRIWDQQTDRPVRCHFNEARESQAKDLLGKQVVASGMVKADRYGRPISMRVEEFDSFIASVNLPTIEEMCGILPDFTGGVSLRQYFEDFE